MCKHSSRQLHAVPVNSKQEWVVLSNSNSSSSDRKRAVQPSCCSQFCHDADPCLMLSHPNHTLYLMDDAALLVSDCSGVVHVEAADLQHSAAPGSVSGAFITAVIACCASAYGCSISLALASFRIGPVGIIAVLGLLATAAASLILWHIGTAVYNVRQLDRSAVSACGGHRWWLLQVVVPGVHANNETVHHMVWSAA